MTIFIPSDNLVKTARSTIQVLAMIAGFTAIIAAGAGAFYVLTWACGMLTLFIHALSSVFYAVSVAACGSWVAQDAGFIFLVTLSVVANAKFACIIFPSLPSFFVEREARA